MPRSTKVLAIVAVLLVISGAIGAYIALSEAYAPVQQPACRPAVAMG